MIKNKFVPGVSVFKMMSGEEIIGRVTDECGDYFYVEMPLSLAMNHNNQLQYVPVMVMSDKEKPHSVLKAAVAITAKPSQKQKEDYEKVTSKVIVPSKPGIIV